MQKPGRLEGGSFAATKSEEQAETDKAVAILLKAISVAADPIAPQPVTPPSQPPPSFTAPTPTHPGQNESLPPLQATLPPLELLKTPKHTPDSFLWPQHPVHVSAKKKENTGPNKVRPEKRKKSGFFFVNGFEVDCNVIRK